MKRALFVLLLISGVASAQLLPPEGFTGALMPISPNDYVGQVSSTYVRRSGDTMSGGLGILTASTYPLKLGAAGSLHQRGICFSPTSSGCNTNGRLLFTDSSDAWDISGISFTASISSGFYITAASHPALVITGGGVKLVGVATGSLPACNAGNQGSAHYDTTLNKWKVCNSAGIGWETLATNTSGNFAGSDAWTAYQPSTTAADGVFDSTTVLVGPYYSQSDILGSPRNIVCQFGTAGANGGGANTVTVGIYDVTAAADACTCVLSGVTCASNRSAVGRCDCLGSVMTSNHAYSLYLHGDTDCGTNPGQISCTVMVEY